MVSNTGPSAINRILYVDDEPGMLEIGKLFLEDNHLFRVDVSSSAPDALNQLYIREYDAIVSDFEMPKMNGIAFLKALRARGDTTPFIIFTGRGREDVVIEALNSGADFYLQKGGDPTAQFAELEHKILRAISKRQSDLALKKSEQDYRQLIEHASEAIFVIQDDVFQLVNPQARELSGYSEEELLGQPFVRFAHQDDRASLLEAFRNRSTGVSVPSHYTFRIIRKDGAIRWAELNVVGIIWDGRPAILNFLTDITDRKLAEDALRTSEGRYRHLIEHAGEAIFVTQDEVFRLVNPQLTGVSGYSQQELLSQPFTRFVHPDDATILRDNYRKRMAGSSDLPSHYIFRIIRKEGTIRWVELSVVLIDWNGAPAILNFMIDITERKLAEDALKESEERYRHLIEHAGEGIYVVQDGYLQMVNSRSAEMCGYSEQELLSQPFEKFVHPDDVKIVIDRFRKRLNGEILPSRYPFRIVRKDGTIRWVELSVVLIDWNGAPATLNYVTDITERKRAEDALKESEERYRQFFRTSLDGLFITTRDGRWIDFNDATVEMFGCRSRNEVFEKPITMFYTNPEDRAAIVRRVEQEGYVKEYPLLFRRLDNTLFDAIMTVVSQRNPDGSTRLFIGTLRDITEHKRTEDALKESEERYRQFFRTSLDGLFITTMDGRWIDFNDAIVDLLGYSSREEIFSIPLISVYAHPEERARFIERLEHEGYVKEFPLQMRRRDGSVIDALMTVALQKNADGSAKALIGTIRDVTKRNRSESALKESEDRYRVVTQMITDFIWDWDIRTGSILWFGDIDATLGYAAGEFPRTFEAWERLIHPDDRVRVMDALDQSLDTGERFDEVYRIQARDGTYRYFHDRGAAIADANGARCRMFGAATDITERRNIEASLRESEERYRQFFRTTLDSVFITTPEGRYIDFNDALMETLGCKNREETFAIDVASTYAHPKERESFLEEVRQKGFIRERLIQFRKRDGTVFDTLISIVPLKNPDGSVTAYIGTVRDITDQRRAEIALRESEERYRRIFESFEDLYYQTDNNGIITILSPSLYRLTGWREEELIGQPVSTIYVNPEDRRSLLEELAKSGHVRDYEVLLRKKDGTQTLTSLSANRIYHPDGSSAGVAGILRDITRRKRAEDALKESETKFRSLVDHALEAILIVDLQGTILFANNASARTIDAATCADLMGRNVLEFVAPESRNDVVKDFMEVARGHDAYVARYHLISLTGRDVFVESIGKVILYEGKPADIISLRDVTNQPR